MRGYRFITNDDTSEFCHRVVDFSSNGSNIWTNKNGADPFKIYIEIN